MESALTANPELGDSPVRLIDARFIVELDQRGGTIVRRQDLPEAAFIGLDTLKRLGENSEKNLKIISISHPWQQPNHPDPKEVNVKLLAKVLKLFIDHDGGGTYGIFFDFMDLFQRGPNSNERNEVEAALFKIALSNMMEWYAHPKVFTFKLTKLPDGYPDGFTFPAGCTPNRAGYFDRRVPYLLAQPTTTSNQPTTSSPVRM